MSIGSVVTVPSLGRLATVVGTTAVGVPQDGPQYMQVHYSARVPDTAAGGTSDGSFAPSSVTETARTTRPVKAAGDCSDCRDDEDMRLRYRKDDLTAEERAALDRLRQIDSAARQEENAHAAAAGAAAGPIRYSYQTGPDGRQYATSGKVTVSFDNPAGDPARLAEAANRISAAANAATNPSAADLGVALQGYRDAAAATQAVRPSLDIIG